MKRLYRNWSYGRLSAQKDELLRQKEVLFYKTLQDNYNMIFYKGLWLCKLVYIR